MLKKSITMQIPNYKRIYLDSSDAAQVESQLLELDLQSAPHIIHTTHLKKTEELCLGHLDNFFMDHQDLTLPYPCYIITTVKKSYPYLNTFTEESKLPKFYQIKERQLNSKETALKQKLELKIKNFKNIETKESLTSILKYASDHRSIQNLEHELNFYQRIMQQISKD